MIDVQVEKDEKLIRLIAKEVKAHNGSKFIAFSAVQKDKRLMDCKFINSVNQKPTQSCYIRVKLKDINIDRNRLYPVLWVRHVLEIYIDENENDERDERYAEDVADNF